jgi:hypothetical protein
MQLLGKMTCCPKICIPFLKCVFKFAQSGKQTQEPFSLISSILSYFTSELQRLPYLLNIFMKDAKIDQIGVNLIKLFWHNFSQITGKLDILLHSENIVHACIKWSSLQ